MENKINRWLRSDDRKQIVDELEQIRHAQSEMIKEKKEWERHGKVDEWKEKYLSYWNDLRHRKSFLLDVIKRGDNGESVDHFFLNGEITEKKTGRKRNEAKWNEAYRVMRVRLKDYRYTVEDKNGKVSKNKLFKYVEESCGLAVKTLHNNVKDFPNDIKNLLK